jgi:hypothetical protein
MPAAPSVPLAVQVAILQRLAAHFTAQGLSVPVFDRAPQGQAMPFLEVGFARLQDVSGVRHRALNIVVPLVAYSSHKGQKEAHQINAEIRAALHERDADLSLTTGHCVRCQVDQQSTDVDGDGATYLASSVVSLLVEP